MSNLTSALKALNKTKTFNVTLVYEVTTSEYHDERIEAQNEQEAREIANQRYADGEIMGCGEDAEICEVDEIIT